MFSYHEAASLMDTSAFHSPVSTPLPISLHASHQRAHVAGVRFTQTCIIYDDLLCLRADVRIRMQLQQRGGGAVPDGGEAAAHPDEAAQSECEYIVFSD